MASPIPLRPLTYQNTAKFLASRNECTRRNASSPPLRLTTHLINHHPHHLHRSLSLHNLLLLSPPPISPLLRPRSPHLRPSQLFMTTTAQAAASELPQSSTKTVRLVIKGRVQGVFYRNWTIENATQLGLRGWVRNRRDGSVETLLSGDSQAVQEMEQRCRRGPPSAMVTALEVYPSTDDPGSGFERKQTMDVKLTQYGFWSACGDEESCILNAKSRDNVDPRELTITPCQHSMGRLEHVRDKHGSRTSLEHLESIRRQLEVAIGSQRHPEVARSVQDAMEGSETSWTVPEGSETSWRHPEYYVWFRKAVEGHGRSRNVVEVSGRFGKHQAGNARKRGAWSFLGRMRLLLRVSDKKEIKSHSHYNDSDCCVSGDLGHYMREGKDHYLVTDNAEMFNSW